MSKVWDPGLQPERTALAWQRTALACAVAALALCRLAVHRASSPAAFAALAATVVALLSLASVRAGYRRTRRRLGDQQPIAGSGPALLTTVGILLIAVGTVLVIP